MRQIPDKMQLNIYLNKGYFSFLVAIITLIILPIHVKYLPPCMILWCLTWLLENHSQFKKIRDSNRSFYLLFLLFISYYLWEAVSLIYSTDIHSGLSNLFGRLSFLIFPFVLILPGEWIRRKIKILIRVFALSTFLFLVVCFIFALIKSLTLRNGLWIFDPVPPNFFWLNHFYGSNLTMNQHPTYIAMYVLLSIFICFEILFDYTLKIKYRICWLAIGVLLLISQYFLSSRAGILISLVLVPVYFIIKFRQLGKFKFAWIGIILIVVALLPVIVKNQRVDYLFGRITGKNSDYIRGEDPRFLIWESALKIAQKNLLLGVGIGDVRKELALEYKRIGEEKMAQEGFNAHNQFLEVLLENGIIGLILFVTVFGIMIYIAFVEKNLLYGLFIIMMFSFFMFETVLYRLAGVSFFSLFSFLLLHVNTQKVSDS
jgi:O-antigen ligase